VLVTGNVAVPKLSGNHLQRRGPEIRLDRTSLID
jgi:hypothetical protein